MYLRIIVVYNDIYNIAIGYVTHEDWLGCREETIFAERNIDSGHQGKTGSYERSCSLGKYKLDKALEKGDIALIR